MNKPVVLITGALTGIGRATALAFAREGARVAISGRRDEAGQKLAAELQKLGAEAEFLRADVRHDENVRDLVDRTVARLRFVSVSRGECPQLLTRPLRQKAMRSGFEGLSSRSIPAVALWSRNKSLRNRSRLPQEARPRTGIFCAGRSMTVIGLVGALPWLPSSGRCKLSRQRKLCFGVTLKPTRETPALPGIAGAVLSLTA